MRKTDAVKKIGTKVLSAILTAGLLAGMLPADMFLQNGSGVAEAAAPSTEKVRLVLDDISELPQYNNDVRKSSERGTSVRPFTILEVLGREEQAEFGYLIGGCEPVKVEMMCGDDLSYLNKAVGSLGTATINNTSRGDVYFFEEEPEAQTHYYSSLHTWGSDRIITEPLSVKGYFERVENGKGDFEVRDGGIVKATSTANGNIVWHTLNDYLLDTYPYKEKSFPMQDEFVPSMLDTVGKKFYTCRERCDTDPMIDVGGMYRTYVNNENFLRLTMQLTERQIGNYSIAIKSLTPEELNANPEWIDYADLICISPVAHNGEIANTYILKDRDGNPFNRANHSLSSVAAADNKIFNTHDISWEVAKKIFYKVNAETDYAALLLDNNLYESGNYTSKTYNMKFYDYNGKKLDGSTSVIGVKNNVYKLAMMSVSMNSNLVKQLFLENGVISASGDDTRQDAQNQAYWSPYTFAVFEPGVNASNAYSLTSSTSYWQAVNGLNSGLITQENYKNYVYGRVYTYKGNTSISMQFANGTVGANPDLFDEFNDFMLDDTSGAKNANTALPADALRYILGIRPDYNPFYGGSLRVLDLEPGVGLLGTKTNGCFDKDWQLTENAVQVMAPNFTGTITITHQTTNEFVGKIEDLNSIYDMIYIGIDCGAYNLRTNQEYISELGKSIDWTDYNDSALDGKRYYHTGDYMVSTGKKGQTVDFAVGNSGERLRYSGNDISYIKMKEIEGYLASGKPVVVPEEITIDTVEARLVTADSYIHKLTKQSAYVDNGIYSNKNTYGIGELLKKSLNQKVEILTTPTLYKADNISTVAGKAVINNPGYLPKSGGKSYLEFRFVVPSNEYDYRIYVDKDRDSRFTNEEIVKHGVARSGDNRYTYTLSSTLLGLIQWKLEIYKRDNGEVRKTITGCSAVEITDASQKKEISVLQIMPNNSNNVNLETDSRFKKYYSNLAEFNVKVKAIKWNDFNAYFKHASDSGHKFSFNIGKAVCIDDDNAANQNPNRDNLIAVEDYDGGWGKLSDYNMIVVGFADTYGDTDMTDIYGASEYLMYFTESGKSILYTHDLTSLYNEFASPFNAKKFGATANTMLRDQMGMNRYGMISKNLSFLRPGLAGELEAYRNTTMHDSISDTATQGFSFFALHKLGTKNGSSSVNTENKQPYRYSIKYPDSNSYIAGNNGFSDENYHTTKAAKLNEGQITTYPYYINDSINVATTHAQWYQLNVDDPNVTVWYCLEDNGSYSGNGSIGVAVSPNDAVNNYYIYSKGNIYYSGVGHSAINGDEETKLFVNTMIAAYRQTYDAPHVEVTNKTVIEESPIEYSLQILREYNENASGAANDKQTFSATDMQRVYFKPIDGSFSSKLNVRISYLDISANPIAYIDKVYAESDGSVHTAGSDHFIAGLENDTVYYFDYPKAYLDSKREIHFDVMNDVSTRIGKTDLHMIAQPMFRLD